LPLYQFCDVIKCSRCCLNLLNSLPDISRLCLYSLPFHYDKMSYVSNNFLNDQQQNLKSNSSTNWANVQRIHLYDDYKPFPLEFFNMINQTFLNLTELHIA
ncbi:unnamed protein product, partial [Didymodactylos carnosus]